MLYACGGGGDLNGNTVVPTQAVKNAYRQTNLAATSAAYRAQFTIPSMVDAWGIAIRPAGAGGHFWVLGGGTSWQFVGDVSASSDPKLRTLFQDGLAEVYLPGADSLNTSESVGKATGTAFNGAPINSDQFRITSQTATAGGAVVTVGTAWAQRRATGATTIRRILKVAASFIGAKENRKTANCSVGCFQVRKGALEAEVNRYGGSILVVA